MNIFMKVFVVCFCYISYTSGNQAYSDFDINVNKLNKLAHTAHLAPSPGRDGPWLGQVGHRRRPIVKFG